MAPGQTTSWWKTTVIILVQASIISCLDNYKLIICFPGFTMLPNKVLHAEARVIF